jgi:hypothetical protein
MEHEIEDRLPKRSYELIAMLDEAVAEPKWPKTGHEVADLDDAAVRALCHAAGAREVVDQLIAQVAEEVSDAENLDEGAADGPGDGYPTVFGPDGSVREWLSSLRMADGDPKSRMDDGDSEG